MQHKLRTAPFSPSVAALAVLLSAAAAAQQAPEDDFTSLFAAFEVARHRAMPTAEGLWLNNPGAQLSVELDTAGFTVRPASGTWTWGLALEGDGLGEQRNAPPAAAADQGALTFDLDVLGGLQPALMADARGVPFLDEAGTCALTYTGLTVFDAAGRVLDASFGERGSDLSLTIDATGAVYPLTIDPVIQLAYLKGANTEANDRFGYSVAIDGDTAVIGAPGESGAGVGTNAYPNINGAAQAGAAYVFVRDGCAWTQQAYLKASNTNIGDRFGSSVSISGDLIVVGAPGEQSAASGID